MKLDEETRLHLESLTGHVRALQGAVTLLLQLAPASEEHKDRLREMAARLIAEDNVPMSNADYPSRDGHDLALSSLEGLLAHRRLTQVPIMKSELRSG